MSTVRRHQRPAFTLIEAMVAMTITVVAGSAVLLGIATSIQTTNDALARTQAAGMAQQLMDEIAGQMYCEDLSVPYQYPLGAFGESRDELDDIDDYLNLSARPPTDRFGVVLGTEDRQGGQRDPNFRIDAATFADWEQTVDVYYVDAADPSQSLPAGQTSSCRAVDVTIHYHDTSQGTRPLAKLRRVFSYVPVD
jgi:type II secretory pathway pseudopilin PulG